MAITDELKIRVIRQKLELKKKKKRERNKKKIVP